MWRGVLAGVVLGLVALPACVGLPTTAAVAKDIDEVVPRARRASDARPAVAVPQHAQALVQSAQNVVDQDGDEHVQDEEGDEDVEPRNLPRGVMGSTDHLKDDQFFLSVSFAEAEFNTVLDVTWVRPAAQTSKLDYVGLYQADDLDDAIPCNWEFAEGEEGSGTVQLQMTNHGNMEIRYFDVAADRPRVRVPVVVFPPCPNNCTNHGVCEKGQCVCFPPYKGESCCEVGGQIKVEVNASTVLVGDSVHVTLTAPADALDKRNWIGVFHAPAPSAPDAQQDAGVLLQSELAGAGPTAFTDGSVDGEVETVNITHTPPLSWRYVDDQLDLPMPYVAGQYVLKIVKNVIDDHPVLGSSGVIYVHNECPNNCSGHGVCLNGTCKCDEGYEQFPDCSVGDGLVVLSATPMEGVVGTVVTVEWERNADGPFSNLDYMALFDAADAAFDAPYAYQYAQPLEVKVAAKIERPEGAKVPKEVDRGSVEFSMPTAKGSYVVRYFRKDHTQFAATDPIEVYFDCANPTCSDHGTCVKGVCQCNEGWKSSDCSVGDGAISVTVDKLVALVQAEVEVKWARPAKVGSAYDFVALYDHGAPNDAPYMYRYCHNDEGDDTQGTVKLQLPARAGMFEVRYVDAFSRETQAATDPIEAHLPCPNECSGHGTCEKDTCSCQEGWTVRKDCSAKVGVTQLTATPLTLETPSDKTISVAYKRPEGTGSAQDFIGLFPKSEANNRHPLDFAIPTTDFGTVKFNVPFYDGLYNVRYIGGDDNEMRAHSADIDVTKACLNHCSEHGRCNRGTCECANGWGGLDCSIGQGPTSVSVGPKLGNPGDKIVITYTRPTNNGGPYDFLAVYKKGETNMATPLTFVMATENDHDSVEGTMPNVEAELEVHYVKGDDQTSVGISNPFNVVFACKDDCNGHGECKLGLCTCISGWDGFACDQSVPTAFVVAPQELTVAPLATVAIDWQAVPRDSSPSDYVALFAANDVNNAAPVTYEYTAGQATGTTSLMGPYQAGQYKAKYVGFKKGEAEILAESDTIEVVVPPKSCPDNCNDHGTCDTTTGECKCDAGWSESNCAVQVPTEWTVKADKSEYEEAFWVQAEWTRPPENDGNYLDRIGVFETGPSSKPNPVTLQYVGMGNSGKVTLRAPTPASARQTFELRFVNGANSNVEAKSAKFDVVRTSAPGKASRRALHK